MRSFLSLALVWTSLAILSVATVAQESSPPRSVALVYLYQGEEIQLPEDFVARLDGDQLKVALKSFGLAEKNLDRELLVSLIQEDGTRTELRPDANGELVFKNVKEGLSALVVASGQAAYAALAVYAIPAVGNVSTAFEVPVATVDESGLATAVESSGTAPMGESLKPLGDYKTKKVNRFRVYLQPNGTLRGRVVVPESGFEQNLAGVNLSFFQGGVLAAKAVTVADGTFYVDGLRPGLHSVFANGPPGHAAYAFEVVAPKVEEVRLTSTEDPHATKLVSFQPAPIEPAGELIVLIIPPRLMPGVRDAVRQSYPAAGPVDAGMPFANGLAPGMGGGGGGGFGGGGLGGGGAGGGFGAGGIGALLGIAGLAVGVAALSDDSDGFNVNLATGIGP